MVRPFARLVTTASFGLAFCATALYAQQATYAQANSRPQPRQSSVTFRDGLLTVEASNASLNGILHEIARSTGMKISGSAPEDRVFGTYGPADPQHVMNTLLDGTGTNIFIVSNAKDRPLELMLTPRTGAATQPTGNTYAQTQQQSGAQETTEAMSNPGFQDNRSGGNMPGRPTRPATTPDESSDPAADTAPSEVSQPVVFPQISPTTPAATGTTTPSDPDNDQDSGTEGVKTPQQIFEQLQAMQQGNPGSGTNPVSQGDQQK